MAFADMKIEEIKIETPWGQIAAKCWNSKDSKPILVAHGLSDNAGSFDRLIPLLSKDFYYVVLDLPGHGFSSHFPYGLPLDFMNYVNQLQRVIRYFGWETFSLMGHSVGASILALFAASFPSKVEKIIFLDTCSPLPVPKDLHLFRYRQETENLLKWEEKFKNAKNPCFKTYEEALSTFMKTRWTKLNLESAELILKRCLKKTDEGYVLTMDPRARILIVPVFDEGFYHRIYSEIKCPVLIILADESEMTYVLESSYYLEFYKIYQKTHALSKIVKVKGNHCVHTNSPEVVAPVINQFLLSQQSKY